MMLQATNQDSVRQHGVPLYVERAEEAASGTQWHEAIAWMRKAVAEDPSTANLGSLAFYLSRDSQYAEATSILESLHEQEPEVARWPYMVGYQLYMQASNLLTDRRNSHRAQSYWEQAIRWFDVALAIFPNYAVVLYRKGYALHHLGQLEEAEGTLRHCIAQWDEWSDEEKQTGRKVYSNASFQLGKILMVSGRPSRARIPLITAVETDPDNVHKRYLLGKCYLKMDGPQFALEHLERAHQIDPHREYITDRLAQAHKLLGNLSEARRLYASILEHKRRPYILRNMGALLVECEEFQEAESLLRQAIRKEYNNHYAHYSLALALEAKGKLADAHREYLEAEKIRRESYSAPYPDARDRARRILERSKGEGIDLTQSGVADALIGVIETYKSDRGFGFIRAESGQSVFFHVTDVSTDLVPTHGAEVSFELTKTDKGLRAIEVRAAG